MSPRVVMVDSGGSNLGSVQAALRRLGVDAPVTGDWDRIAAASHVLLPGVGAAPMAMQQLDDHHLVRRLPTLRQPLLGVCVGVQLLFERSAEGPVSCLGVLPGQVERLTTAPGLRIPHMGWNRLRTLRPHPLIEGLEGAYAYFVHSYAAPVGPCTVAESRHGNAFSAVVVKGNFMGAQFHPERSGAAGARLLSNFLAMEGPYPC